MPIAPHPAELVFLAGLVLSLLVLAGLIYLVVRLAVRHGARDAHRTDRSPTQAEPTRPRT